MIGVAGVVGVTNRALWTGRGEKVVLEETGVSGVAGVCTWGGGIREVDNLGSRVGGGGESRCLGGKVGALLALFTPLVPLMVVGVATLVGPSITEWLDKLESWRGSPLGSRLCEASGIRDDAVAGGGDFSSAGTASRNPLPLLT